MRIGIVVSNAAVAAPTHTTVHLAVAALAQGWQVRVLEPWDFEIGASGRIGARAHAFDAPTTREALAAALATRTAARRSIDVDRLDVLLLRANPFQDTIVTFAQLAEAAGVRVLNQPGPMIRTSHKGYVATLADVPRPRTLVTRSRAAVDRFVSDCEAGVVVKPARGCGGKGVGLVRNRRRDLLDEAIDAATRAGDGYLVVQEYLPEAKDGEKRLLWLEGRLVGGYLRQRAPGEFRHNLRVGGQPAPAELGAEDHALIEALTPHLRRDGVWFAGIDVIGGRVVEVNALNPGGIHYSEHFGQRSIAEPVVRTLAQPHPWTASVPSPELPA